MKKSATAFLAGILCLSLSACGSSAPAADAEQGEVPAEGETVAEVPEEEAPAEEKLTWEIGEPVFKTYEQYGTQSIFAAIPVTNTSSSSLFLASASIDLEDTSGHLVDSFRFGNNGIPSILAPGEAGYFIYSEYFYGYELPEDFTIKTYATLEKSAVDPIRYEISDVSVTGNSDSVKVTGRIENATDADAEYVDVYCLLFDSDNKLISELSTFVENLSAGEKYGFSAESWDVDFSKVDHCEVYSYPYQSPYAYGNY